MLLCFPMSFVFDQFFLIFFEGNQSFINHDQNYNH
jgi:hypothetical protein